MHLEKPHYISYTNFIIEVMNEGCFGFCQPVNAKESRLYESVTFLESHLFTATFEIQSVLLIGWVLGGYIVCSQHSEMDVIQETLHT